MAEQWVSEIESACCKERTAFFFKPWDGVSKKGRRRSPQEVQQAATWVGGGDYTNLKI
jgi:protein gp37